MKDPAFLFYSKDFITGVSDLNFEERGQYITLLCLQHQKGHLSKKLIDMNCPNVTQDVLSKFIIDENGLYYNKRLESESNKRIEHAEKQRDRAIKGWEKRKEESKNNNSGGNATAYATAMPLVNANVNVNENINTNVIEKKVDKNIEKATDVLLYLNQQANRAFKPKESTTLKHIIARLKEGHEQQVLFDVIDLKCYEWLNDAKMCEYLRPETLFNQTKFDNYIEQLTRAKSNPEQFKNNADVRKKQSKSADGLTEMQRYKQDLLNGIYRE